MGALPSPSTIIALADQQNALQVASGDIVH